MKEQHALPTSQQVDRRLRIVAELRNLCLSLGRAKPLSNPRPSQALREMPEGESVSARHEEQR